MDELAVSASDPSRNMPYASENVPSSSKIHDKLWVDEYRPQQYTDLLGDDRVHREVMAWVKEWDYCVFGKSKGKQRMAEDGQHFDEYRRPQERVIQLYFPISPMFLTLCFSAVVNFWSTRLGKDNAGACHCEASRVQGFRDQREVRNQTRESV